MYRKIGKVAVWGMVVAISATCTIGTVGSTAFAEGDIQQVTEAASTEEISLENLALSAASDASSNESDGTSDSASEGTGDDLGETSSEGDSEIVSDNAGAGSSTEEIEAENLAGADTSSASDTGSSDASDTGSSDASDTGSSDAGTSGTDTSNASDTGSSDAGTLGTDTSNASDTSSSDTASTDTSNTADTSSSDTASTDVSSSTDTASTDSSTTDDAGSSSSATTGGSTVENSDEVSVNVISTEKNVLVITCPSAEYIYDGTVKTVSDFTVSARTTDAQTLEASKSFDLSGEGMTVSGIECNFSAKDAGEYEVTVTGTPVITDATGADVTDTYEVEIVTGTLKINKRSLVLTSDSASKKYDGEALTSENVTVTGDGFADGEGATYSFTGKQKKVGESYNYFTYTMNEGTNEANYDISAVPGILTVKEAKDSTESSSSATDSSTTTDTTSTDTTTSESTSEEQTVDSSTASSTQADSAQVLGAKRSDESDASESAGQVLGARRSGTGDPYKLPYRVSIICGAIIILGLMIRNVKFLLK